MDFATGLLIFGWLFVIVWVPLVVLSQRKIHPKALFTLFFTELWERFSFYGMRAFLVLYMGMEVFKALGEKGGETRALGIYGAFNALLYAAPVIGGILADRVMGFRKAIILGGLLMAAGQFTLAANAKFVGTEWLLFVGLGVLAVGNGFFKPNISSFLGTFYETNDIRKDRAFTIFYMGINIGAFLAPITCGYLAKRVDWSLGFLSAGLGMLLGLIVFWRNMSKYEDKGNPPNLVSWKESFFGGMSKQTAIVLGALLASPLLAFLIKNEEFTNYILIGVGIICIGYILYEAFTSTDKVVGQKLLAFVFLFIFHMIFWTLFEQAGGSLNFLTEKFVNRHEIETPQFQAVNPFFIMIFAPVFSWLWGKLRSANMEPATPIKFFFGLLQMALGYFIIVWGATSILGSVNDGALIPLVFLLAMYLFHTTGELSISPVGLSVVTKLSPAKIVGFVMGTWFLSIAFAHKIAGEIGKSIASPGEGADKATALKMYSDVYMTWGVYILLGAAVVLLLLSPFLKKLMHGVK